MSRDNSPSAQRIRNARESDDALLDPAYLAQMAEFWATLSPAGVGTSPHPAPTARPAGVGVPTAFTSPQDLNPTELVQEMGLAGASPRRRTPSSSSSSPSPSPPPTPSGTVPGTRKNLVTHRILHAPMTTEEETRLRQQYHITDDDLERYSATLPGYDDPAGSPASPVRPTAVPAATITATRTTASAPGGPGGSPSSSSSPSPPRAPRGRGRRPRGRRGPGPTNRRNQEDMRRQMDLLAEDARQQARHRRIRNITHTNTVTTVYEDNGEAPTVRRTSSRITNP